jgi:hypothetical protein
MQHLFFKCPSVKKNIKEIEAIFNRSGLTANIEIKELNIMLGLYGGEDLDVIFNTVHLHNILHIHLFLHFIIKYTTRRYKYYHALALCS